MLRDKEADKHRLHRAGFLSANPPKQAIKGLVFTHFSTHQPAQFTVFHNTQGMFFFLRISTTWLSVKTGLGFLTYNLFNPIFCFFCFDICNNLWCNLTICDVIPQHLWDDVCIYWCIKQDSWGRRRSPGWFHWERHSKYVEKCFLFALTRCKLPLYKPISHQRRWKSKCFPACRDTRTLLDSGNLAFIWSFHAVWL